MAKTTGQYSSFPSQAVSDSEKRSDDYGLQVAKAIEQDWFNRDGNVGRFYQSSNQYNMLRLYR